MGLCKLRNCACKYLRAVAMKVLLLSIARILIIIHKLESNTYYSGNIGPLVLYRLRVT